MGDGSVGVEESDWGSEEACNTLVPNWNGSTSKAHLTQAGFTVGKTLV